MAKLPKKQNASQLNIDKATNEELFNELVKFMMSNKYRNSATRDEVSEYFKCSRNKATRLLHSFSTEKRILKDTTVENLYWLNLDAV